MSAKKRLCQKMFCILRDKKVLKAVSSLKENSKRPTFCPHECPTFGQDRVNFWQ